MNRQNWGRKQTPLPYWRGPPLAVPYWARCICLRDDTSTASVASSRCANETACSRSTGFQMGNYNPERRWTTSEARDTVFLRQVKIYPSTLCPGEL